MTENEAARWVVDAAFKVHTALGPGLLESVYETVLARELAVRRGLSVRRQVRVPITYDGMHFEEAFRADVIVEGVLIVEIKSIAMLHSVHTKQLLTYLRLTNRKLGLLINFGAPLIKEGIRRVVNGMPD